MASNDHDIEVLNNLIAITLDSGHGYEAASHDTKNAHFKTMFGKRAIERKQVTAELQTEVRRLLGGKPATSGTMAGKAHRVFMDLKASITGSEKGIVNSVEAGEDHIKKEYEDALVDEQLSAPVMDLIRTAYGSVKAGHDEMRDLKHHMQE
ncbi:MAG TPA: PA2169 family four-helix-bundle protein [Aliidongia sp.]|nr:PA2169 family four-helix-bundle protein [Aliidongia sp.]